MQRKSKRNNTTPLCTQIFLRTNIFEKNVFQRKMVKVKIGVIKHEKQNCQMFGMLFSLQILEKNPKNWRSLKSLHFENLNIAMFSSTTGFIG